MASFSFANNRVKMASAARSLKIIISADRWWSASGFIIFLFFCFFFLASLCAPRGLEELNAANSIRTVNSSPSQLACSGLRQRSVKAERRRERERERGRGNRFSVTSLRWDGVASRTSVTASPLNCKLLARELPAQSVRGDRCVA